MGERDGGASGLSGGHGSGTASRGQQDAGTRARHSGNRHGRSARARQAVLEAADDLLVEKGLAGVTIEGIAARAGVAKQTIYRWWSSKTEVLLDALVEDEEEDLVPPERGELAPELREHLHRLAAFLTCSDAGAVFRALAGHAQHDPAFATAFRGRHVARERQRNALPLERAVARGELPAGLDASAEADRLVGPLYYRVLVTGGPVDRAFTDGLVSDFLRLHGLPPG